MENKDVTKGTFKVEYLILNLKILPAPGAGSEYYFDLLQRWYGSTKHIKVPGDTRHYYILTRFDHMHNRKIVYGTITKFDSLNAIDFVDDNNQPTGYGIPENQRARLNEYEFIFVPECHRFALIKSGKLRESIKKVGRSFRGIEVLMVESLKNFVPEGTEVHASLELKSDVFEEIFNSRLLDLKFKLSYTNDDLNEEHAELFDDLLKESQVASFSGKMKPDANGEINTDGKLVSGILQLAKQNGVFEAEVKPENAKKKRIRSEDHPLVEEIKIKDPVDRTLTFMRSLYDAFMEKYR